MKTSGARAPNSCVHWYMHSMGFVQDFNLLSQECIVCVCVCVCVCVGRSPYAYGKAVPHSVTPPHSHVARFRSVPARAVVPRGGAAPQTGMCACGFQPRMARPPLLRLVGHCSPSCRVRAWGTHCTQSTGRVERAGGCAAMTADCRWAMRIFVYCGAESDLLHLRIACSHLHGFRDMGG